MEKEFSKSENGESLKIVTTYAPVVHEEYIDLTSLEEQIQQLQSQINNLNGILIEKQQMLQKFNELNITKKITDEKG